MSGYLFKVYLGGSFDICHVGHINFFRQVRNIFKNCHITVALNTDEFIEKYKKVSPVFNYNERKYQLELTGLIDEIIPNTGGADSKSAILQVLPNVICIGTDWLEKDYPAQMGFTADWLKTWGISLIYIPYTDGISSTEIKRRLNAN